MEGYEGVSYSLAEWRKIKSQVFGDSLPLDRISVALTIRLVTDARYLYHNIINEIQALEKDYETATKPASQFKHHPLYPLWKKHFFSADQFLLNIGLRWGMNSGDGNRDLATLIMSIAHKYGDNPDIWPHIMTHEFVHKAFQDRAAKNKLTGHWLVFGKFKGKNYYLDLATHLEGSFRNSDKLMEKLRAGSMSEFSFVFGEG